MATHLERRGRLLRAEPHPCQRGHRLCAHARPSAACCCRWWGCAGV